MRKWLTCTLAALAVWLPHAASAQATKDADPALWVVKDPDTTVYLFGTVHVLKPGLSWFDEGVKQAFDSSGELVLEMIEPDPMTAQALVMQLAIDPAGKPLTERLPAGKRAAYGKVLADLGIPAEALDRFDPWMAAMTLGIAGIARLGYNLESGAERTLTAAAKTANKKLVGLETPEQQFGFLDGLPERLQIKMLVSTIDEFPQARDVIERMVGSWSAGDAEKLGKIMNEEFVEMPEVGKVLLTDRNVRWADWIRQRMNQPGTVFIAVGGGPPGGRRQRPGAAGEAQPAGDARR